MHGIAAAKPHTSPTGNAPLPQLPITTPPASQVVQVPQVPQAPQVPVQLPVQVPTVQLPPVPAPVPQVPLPPPPPLP
jgi:hypothetical protein